MSHSGSEIAPLIFQPLSFQLKTLTLFAVNNNPDASTAQGGTHWSLAAFLKPTNSFHHYDSFNRSNASKALQLYECIKSSLPVGSRYIEEEMQQQQNNSDCGVYVIACAEALCRRLHTSRNNNRNGHYSMRITEDDISPAKATQLRKEMYTLIMQKSQLSG